VNLFKCDIDDRVDLYAIGIVSEQSYAFNKTVGLRSNLKLEYYYDTDLPRLVDTASGTMTLAFENVGPGWYGVQGKVEVIELEKVLRKMESTNFFGNRFLFEFHEVITSKYQMNSCLRAFTSKKNVLGDIFDLSVL